MEDYFLIWSDCPSVSFFFARLCNLLGIVGRKRPRVGLFVEKNFPYRSVLLFLFPLVHHFIRIAQSLTMSEGGRVRSSELETGLSSSKDYGVLKVSSPSTPYKAWGIC